MKLLFTLCFIGGFTTQTYAQRPSEIQLTWTYTYIKAKSQQRKNLETYLIKNWLVMDSIAIQQGLFNNYELVENRNPADTTWDFMVAVEYFTEGAYQEIAEPFEKIRLQHTTQKVNNLPFPQLGQVVRSETVRKAKKYSRN